MSRQTLYFFLVSVTLIALAAGIAQLLMTCFPRPEQGPGLRFPVTFCWTSLLLLAGSLSLERALGFLRLERPRQYRTWLVTSLSLGTLFMGVQTFALWSMFPEHRDPADASLEATGFALALAALHALHFLVAVLFVSWVTVRTWANRYDHEYHWGVRVCAWFWHALGGIWVAILFLFLIASR